MSASIPLISMAQPEAELTSAIRTACLTHGFFQIIDCPRPSQSTFSSEGDGDDAFQSRLLAYMRRFFSQPTESKLALAKTDHVRGGYEQFQKYSLQSGRGKPDLNEGYSIAPEFVEREDAATSTDGKSGGGGDNVWPDESTENGLVGFRRTCRDYYNYIEALARKVAALIALGLGLEADYFAAYFARQMAHCRLIHYYAEEQQTGDGVEAQEDKRNKNDIGAGLHTDWGLITILLQDDVGGLQVLDNESETFIPVPPTPDAYVVNCGDLLARFTNGVYTSARHRVIAPPSGIHRYSVPFFCDGNPDYLVNVLPLGEEWKAWVQGRKGKPVEVEKPVYEPIMAGEYFEMKWRESAGGGKKQNAVGA